MLASAQAAEGKTLTAVNLALTLSESYERRVLLIDADLRRPSVAQDFRPAAGERVERVLEIVANCRRCGSPTSRDSLGLLLAGDADHDPMSGLTSGRMQEIIEQAAPSFDWVIIDTPPVGLLTDAHLLAAMVDAAVLVIDAGTTQHAVVQRAIESIGREKIVGVVLNRVERRCARGSDAITSTTDDASRRKRRRGILPGRAIDHRHAGDAQMRRISRRALLLIACETGLIIAAVWLAAYVRFGAGCGR